MTGNAADHQGAFEQFEVVVPSEWIDYNGHLNDGYYAVAFGQATDAVLFHLGLSDGYIADVGTFFTAEARIRYLHEVRLGERILFRSILLAADEKRLHLWNDMIVGPDGTVAATHELMLLHVRQPGPKVAPMAEPMLSAALALAERHATLERPKALGTAVRQLPASHGR